MVASRYYCMFGNNGRKLSVQNLKNWIEKDRNMDEVSCEAVEEMWTVIKRKILAA